MQHHAGYGHHPDDHGERKIVRKSEREPVRVEDADPCENQHPDPRISQYQGDGAQNKKRDRNISHLDLNTWAFYRMAVPVTLSPRPFSPLWLPARGVPQQSARNSIAGVLPVEADSCPMARSAATEGHRFPCRRHRLASTPRR